MNNDVTPEDFIEFFGKTKEELIKDLENEDNSIHKKIYGDISPECESDARKMYTTQEYAGLLIKSITPEHFGNIKKDAQKNVNVEGFGFEMICRFALDHLDKDAKILDYGCGIAVKSLNLYFMGFKNITLADIQHDFFRFLEFLCKKYDIKIKFIPIKDEVADLKEEYDYIICSEVLEHVWRPEFVLEHLVKHLRTGGHMYLSTFFNDMNGHDPLHLKHNNIYQDEEKWFDIVKSIGLKPAIKDKNGVWKIFRKE